MAFGDIIQSNSGYTPNDGEPALLSNATSGNSILILAQYRVFEDGLPTSIADATNSGNYSVVYSDEQAVTLAVMYAFPGTSGGPILITPTPSSAASFIWTIVEMEGEILLPATLSNSYDMGSTAAFDSGSHTIPANSVSIGGLVLRTGVGSLTPSNADWGSYVVRNEGPVRKVWIYHRQDSSSSVATFDGVFDRTDEGIYTVFASFVGFQADYTARKGSTETITHTLTADGITTATLNGETVTIGTQSGQDADINFTDTITTSGVYDLVLGDGVGTETYTVQYNVIGLSSNTLQKEGSALASLTDVELDIFDATGATVLDTLTGITTDASGVTGPTIIATGAVDDTVRVSGYSDSAEIGFAYKATLELL